MPNPPNNPSAHARRSGPLFAALRPLLALCLVGLLGSGCVIGTWPTPEDDPTAQGGGGGVAPIGDETCDELDNDADGSVDEGCPCDTGEVRGCLGITEETPGRCGFGIQRCVGGAWLECGELQGPFTVAREPSLMILEVDPASGLERGANDSVSVRAEASPACAGIVVPHLGFSIAAQVPDMTILLLGFDDGRGSDEVPGDGVYSVEIPNPFGPGVPAQSLGLSVEAEMSGTVFEATQSVPLVDP